MEKSYKLGLIFDHLADELNITKENVNLIVGLKQLETVIVNNNPIYTNKNFTESGIRLYN